MYYLNNAEFQKMIEFEEGMQDKRLKFYSIMSNGKSLKQLAEKCKQELGFDYEQLYADYKKENKSCGAFCHR